MLERAIDMSVRDLRIDAQARIEPADLREAICDRMRIAPNCIDDLVVSLVEISQTDWQLPRASQACRNRTAPILAPLPFAVGSARAGKLVLLRACLPIDPILPGSAFGARVVVEDGTARLLAMSLFTVEPQ
jgi:hypothetical protein